MIKLKRIYQNWDKEDGFRILVDRLWPRGISKEKAKLDLWFKDIAPSNDLRKWYSHDPEKWNEFQKKYLLELKKNSENFNRLKELARKNATVTLLYAAKEEEHNEAVILKKILDNL